MIFGEIREMQSSRIYVTKDCAGCNVCAKYFGVNQAEVKIALS